jgi:hypothetical protein
MLESVFITSGDDDDDCDVVDDDGGNAISLLDHLVFKTAAANSSAA